MPTSVCEGEALALWLSREGELGWVTGFWLSMPGEKCAGHTACPTDLVRILQLGRGTVPEPLHGLHGGVAEVGGLSIHHLNHHDAQRPDVHL